MVELKFNGRFSFVQVLQMFGALLAAMMTSWIMITGVTGYAVRQNIRKELERPNGIIVKEIDRTVETHDRILMDHNHDQFTAIQTQLATISRQIGICETKISNIEKRVQ